MKLCEYKSSISLKTRIEQFSKLRNNKKYGDKIPIICILSDKLIKSKKLAANDECINELYKQGYVKMLVDKDLAWHSFIYGLRNKIEMSPKDGMLVFSSTNTLVPNSNLLSQVYQQYKDEEDNFLYVSVTIESTFGTSVIL